MAACSAEAGNDWRSWNGKIKIFETFYLSFVYLYIISLYLYHACAMLSACHVFNALLLFNNIGVATYKRLVRFEVNWTNVCVPTQTLCANFSDFKQKNKWSKLNNIHDAENDA